MSVERVVKESTLREEIDQFIDYDEAIKAHSLMSQLWHQEPNPAAANFVVSRFEKVRQQLNPVKARVSFLRSFTLEPVVPLLRAAAAKGFVRRHQPDEGTGERAAGRGRSLAGRPDRPPDRDDDRLRRRTGPGS